MIRIGDVAHAAGVSTATVSRALRGLPHVAPATRRRVQAAAARLNYLPHLPAARLAGGATETIAVAVPDPATWFNATLVGALGRETASADYDLLLSAVDSAAELERFVDLNRPGSGRSDALVFVDISLDDTAAQAFVNAGVCAVSVGTTSSAFSSVTVDNVAVGRAATQLLLDHGHRRIGLLSLRVGDSPNLSVPQQRAEGYAQAHSAAGLAADSRLQRATSNRWADARAAAHELLSAAEPPSAIFAMCDEQAFGVMLAARDLGLRIPECLSVVGVDDHDQSELAGLTTVRQHVAAQGTAAAELVLRALDTADPSPAHWRLDTDLVVRRTVGPPHSA